MWLVVKVMRTEIPGVFLLVSVMGVEESCQSIGRDLETDVSVRPELGGPLV